MFPFTVTFWYNLLILLSIYTLCLILQTLQEPEGDGKVLKAEFGGHRVLAVLRPPAQVSNLCCTFTLILTDQKGNTISVSLMIFSFILLSVDRSGGGHCPEVSLLLGPAEDERCDGEPRGALGFRFHQRIPGDGGEPLPSRHWSVTS